MAALVFADPPRVRPPQSPSRVPPVPASPAVFRASGTSSPSGAAETLDTGSDDEAESVIRRSCPPCPPLPRPADSGLRPRPTR